MRLPLRSLASLVIAAFAALGGHVPVAVAQGAAATPPAAPQPAENKGAKCGPDDADIKVASGFCANIFADGVGHARQMVVSPKGVLYINTWSGRYFGNDKPHDGGFLVALQDTKGTGQANVVQRFGETVASGGAGGSGIGLYKGYLYAEINDKIVRYKLSPGAIVPKGASEVVVSGLPLTGDHPMHPFVIDTGGKLFIDVATATNACQKQNRTPLSLGLNPCTELETRGGIWQYDANKTDQVFSPAERYATGIRNGEGFAYDAAGHHLYVTQHGRDQLHANWPALYQPEEEATLPAEELVELHKGGDYGWPFCYYDAVQAKLVLAPEFGGNGGKVRGLCAEKLPPVAAFPAHWGPNGAVFYHADQFPAHYHDGVFIAFHGSWDRAPYAQQGYNVVFQPLSGDHASGKCEVFADGFAGAQKSRDQAAHRPSGLAVAPDGTLYVSDDVRGRIYRIVYHGGGNGTTTPCPSPSDSPGPVMVAAATPPEGTHPDAGAASIGVPPGATRAMVALGDRIYHGAVGGAPCTGCHGANGGGTSLGPNLTDSEWLWSDGSYAGITATIKQGVMQPKQYRAPMPPMGGAQLTPDQLSAVAAYVWGLSHKAT
jgi:glucose/arabinose dehydrogenase/mono/diheme cytochrome c family protein